MLAKIRDGGAFVCKDSAVRALPGRPSVCKLGNKLARRGNGGSFTRGGVTPGPRPSYCKIGAISRSPHPSRVSSSRYGGRLSSALDGRASNTPRHLFDSAKVFKAHAKGCVAATGSGGAGVESAASSGCRSLFGIALRAGQRHARRAQSCGERGQVVLCLGCFSSSSPRSSSPSFGQ
jgi:hypothetical protein